MKILFMTRGRSSRGGHIVVTNLVRGLREEGIDVTLTTFDSEENMERDVPYWNNLKVNFVKVLHMTKRDMQQVVHIEAASKYIRTNIDKFDKIIIDSWFVALAVIREGIFLDKVFHIVQSDPAFLPKNNLEFWKSELFQLLPLTPMNKIIVSKALANAFEKRYKKKFKFIQLFVDRKYLDSQIRIVDRKVLRLISSSSDFNIRTKGLKFLLDSLEDFKDFDFELTLLAGTEIRLNLDKYSFSIVVINAHNVDEMISELKRQDVYINTSVEEAFGLALAEAMALGLPSIALDSVGNREYTNSTNVIFVKNPKNFNIELKRMYNIELRRSLSESSKESMQKYTLQSTLRGLKSMIKI